MANLSKELYMNITRNKSCGQLIHTWNPNCAEALTDFLRESIKGVALFYFAMNMAEVALSRTKLTKEKVKHLLIRYIRSNIVGNLAIACFLSYNCLQYHLLGYLNFYLTIYGTLIIPLPVYLLSPPDRLTIESTCFSIMGVEMAIRFLASHGILPKSKRMGTPLFMITNSFMMYLLWMKQNVNKALKVQWIFKPYSDSEKSENKLCCHEGSCMNDIIRVTKKNVLIGLGIAAAKLLVKFIKKPNENPVKLIFKFSNLKEALFLGSYVGIHKAVHCLLTVWKGEDSYQHALIGGLFAGLSYLIRPNLAVPSTLIVLITLSLFEELKKKTDVPKLPYESLSFLSIIAVFCFFYFFSQERSGLVPKLFPAILNAISRGRTSKVKDHIQLLISEAQ